jgi:transcriptional regulator with XRE-family HTH domain
MNDERQEFSQRLAEAMHKAGYEPRPNVLLKVFNSRYRGESVTAMTISRWLGGRAIPNQDKLQVLADLFGVEPQVLRFGKAEKGRVAESQATWPAALGARERQVIAAYLALPPKRRELVGELVEALATVKPPQQ